MVPLPSELKVVQACAGFASRCRFVQARIAAKELSRIVCLFGTANTVIFGSGRPAIRQVPYPFGLRLCTLTYGCPALVAIFWRQGGRSIPVDSRVPVLENSC